MKIGIITFCEAVNYGAFLQAVSLGEFLKENDQDVEYITTRSLKSFYWNIHNLYAYHLDRIAFRNEFRHKWNKAQKKLKKTKKKSGYDLVIIGSDEMWAWVSTAKRLSLMRFVLTGHLQSRHEDISL